MGLGQKLNHHGTADVSLHFHLPGFQFGFDPQPYQSLRKLPWKTSFLSAYPSQNWVLGVRGTAMPIKILKAKVGSTSFTAPLAMKAGHSDSMMGQEELPPMKPG